MLCAVLCFFNPCNYELPRRHLAATVQMLTNEGITAVLAEVVMSGQQPVSLPMPIQRRVFVSDHVLFFKENLWNIAAQEMTQADELLFIDGDVFFSRPGMLAAAVSGALRNVDLLQPYELAVWNNRQGLPQLTRLSAAEAIAAGITPNPGVFHPGFSWAMTRRAFDALGGWYDREPTGGGDTTFAFALVPPDRLQFQPWMTKQEKVVLAPSWQAYRDRAQAAGLSVGYLPGWRCSHRWHGDHINRGYTTRHECITQMDGHEFPLVTRPDGLHQWRPGVNWQPLRQMFFNRRDDG